MSSLGANQGLIRVHIFIWKCSSRRFALRCRCCLCSPCWLAVGGHMDDGALWLWVKKENVISLFVKVWSCLSDIRDRKTCAYLKKKYLVTRVHKRHHVSCHWMGFLLDFAAGKLRICDTAQTFLQSLEYTWCASLPLLGLTSYTVFFC